MQAFFMRYSIMSCQRLMRCMLQIKALRWCRC